MIGRSTERLSFVFWVKAPFLYFVLMAGGSFAVFFLRGAGANETTVSLCYFAVWGVASCVTIYLIWANAGNVGRKIWAYAAKGIACLQGAVYLYAVIAYYS